MGASHIRVSLLTLFIYCCKTVISYLTSPCFSPLALKKKKKERHARKHHFMDLPEDSEDAPRCPWLRVRHILSAQYILIIFTKTFQ